MILKIKKGSFRDIVFYSIFVLILFSYLGYYFYCKRNNINILMQYSNYGLLLNNVGILPNIIRYAKDVLIVVLFLASVLKLKKEENAYILLGSMILFVYGTCISLWNQYSVTSILTGIRTYLYFIAFVLFWKTLDHPVNFLPLKKIIIAGLLVNMAACLEQALRCTSGRIALIGRGSYRFPGLFGGVNGLAGFGIAVAVLVFILDVKEKVTKRFTVFIFSICLLLNVFGGTRSGIINVLLIIFIWVVNLVRASRIQKAFMILLCMALVIPMAVSLSSSIAQRGSILQVQLESGRINVLKTIIADATPVQLFLGRGLGVGSNSDMLLKRNMNLSGGRVLDGTFNVILFQFGLLGLLAIFYVMYFLFLKIYKNQDFSVAAVFIGTVLLQCFTGNMFETFSFLNLMILNYQLLEHPDRIQGGGH